VEILLDPKIWAGFLTLTALEIVLGIDNLLFLTIVSGRLPAERQPAANRKTLREILRLRTRSRSGILRTVRITPGHILSQRVLSKEQPRPPAGPPRFSRDFTTRKTGRAPRPPDGCAW
jgi:hypothetical protein